MARRSTLDPSVAATSRLTGLSVVARAELLGVTTEEVEIADAEWAREKASPPAPASAAPGARWSGLLAIGKTLGAALDRIEDQAERAERDRDLSAAALDALAPAAIRPFNAQPVAGIAQRPLHLRASPKGQRLCPVPRTLQEANEHHVEAWLRVGWRSTDPTEAELVRRLRQPLVEAGSDPEAHGKARRARWPLVCLAYVLWHAQRTTLHSGYRGAIQGVSRAFLALLSPSKNGGLPVHVDTISVYLRELRGELAGLARWWQPNPGEAVERGLPHTTTTLADGRELHQALNLYWWLPFRATKGPELVGRTDRADPRTAYSGVSVDPPDGSAGDREGKKESRAGPGQDPAPPGRLTTG